MGIKFMNFLIFAIFIIIPFNIERSILGVWVTSSDILMLGSVVMWAFVIIRNKISLKDLSFPLLPIILGFMATFILSYYSSINIMMSMKETIKYIVCFMFLYFLVNSMDEATLRKLPLVVICTAVLLSLFLMNDYISGNVEPIRRIWIRKIGSGVHLSVVGTFLNGTIPLGFYYFFSFKNVFKKLVAALAILIQVIGLYITFSRASWIALLFIMPLILVYNFRMKGFLYFILILIVPFAAISFFLPRLELQKRFLSIANSADVSIVSRKVHMRAAISMIKMKPLTGVGVGNFQMAAQKYLNVNVTGHAHNEFLHFGAEAGIFSMLLFALLIIKFYIDSMGIIFSLPDNNNIKRLLIYGLFGFTSILAAGFFGDPFVRGVKEYFILFLSLPYAAVRLKRNSV